MRRLICEETHCTQNQNEQIRARRRVLKLAINFVYLLLNVVTEKQLGVPGKTFICSSYAI